MLTAARRTYSGYTVEARREHARLKKKPASLVCRNQKPQPGKIESMVKLSVERRRVSGWCYRAGAPSKTRGGTAQALAGFNVKDGHTRGARIHMTRVTVP